MEDEESGQPQSRVVVAVRGWLAEQGYPLEMRTAAMFQKAGANSILQSEYHITPEGKGREIDVRATFWRAWPILSAKEGEEPKPTSSHYVGISAVCECKSGPKSQKPWIVFTTRHNPIQTLPGLPFLRLGSKLGKALLYRAANSSPEIAALDLFKLPERPGYSLSVMMGKRDEQDHDLAYGTLMKLMSAAHAVAEVKSKPEAHANILVFPVLVVDTPIVECWLDDDDVLQVEERERATMLWKNPTISGSMTIIDIVNESAMSTYAAELSCAATALIDYYYDLNPSSLEEAER